MRMRSAAPTRFTRKPNQQNIIKMKKLQTTGILALAGAALFAASAQAGTVSF